MALPVSPLPTDSVEINGESVSIRSLSRTEVVALASFDEDVAGAEVYLLTHSTGVTEAEAKDWLNKVTAKTAGALLEEIAVLSGIRPARNEAGKA